jgi:hypothetical protein
MVDHHHNLIADMLERVEVHDMRGPPVTGSYKEYVP